MYITAGIIFSTPPLPPRNSKDGVRVTTNTDYRVNGNTKNAPPPQKKVRCKFYSFILGILIMIAVCNTPIFIYFFLLWLMP